MDADTLSRENTHLKARLAEVEAALAEVQEANRRLEDILRTSQREKFGKRSEKLSPDQFNLPLEDAELAQGVLEAAQEKAEAALQRARGETPCKPARNRGHLPAHLPRIERVIERASTFCSCGCGEMARIGEDVSERLDVIPAQFQVLVTRRPRYACRRCSQAYMTRVLRLTLLAPDIAEAIMDGRQGPEVTLARVLEPFPVNWAAQPDHFERVNGSGRS